MAETQVKLSEFELDAEKRARHRQLIMQILLAKRYGLTVQQIIDVEAEWYGYTFLTDNRLRELRSDGLAVDEKRKEQKKPALWFPTEKAIKQKMECGEASG